MQARRGDEPKNPFTKSLSLNDSAGTAALALAEEHQHDGADAGEEAEEHEGAVGLALAAAAGEVAQVHVGVAAPRDAIGIGGAAAVEHVLEDHLVDVAVVVAAAGDALEVHGNGLR